jgi:predicted small lipoprotein YifL
MWISAMLVLAGCGQKGALYLPHTPDATSATPNQPVNAEQKTPVEKKKSAPID